MEGVGKTFNTMEKPAELLQKLLKENNLEIRLTPQKIYTDKQGNTVVEQQQIEVIYTPKQE